MAHVKSTWYRRPSIAYAASDETIARQDREYLAWLCRERGWLTDEVACRHCRGTGKTQSHGGGRWREYPCSRCFGGFHHAPNSPDYSRAERYIGDQRDDLYDIARRAVDGIKHRLFWHGLRPVETTFGYVDESRWYFDRKGGSVHVGTRAASRYHGSTKPTFSIVIRPGRAPSALELDLIAEDAVAQLSPGLFDDGRAAA